jgi:glucose-6-phosphate 1-dehydrogenase
MNSQRTAIVILGASGDLAKRKLIPALLNICKIREIDDSTVIIGSGRSVFTDDSFRDLFKVPPQFARKLFYHQGIPGLKKYVSEKGDFSRIIVFFALPPQVYSSTAKELVLEGFGAETSIIIEKPFGSDYQTAVDLNKQLASYFDESRIYRNDHYLAKEAVQNILVFRFANALFYPVWNHRYIESIQINASETEGVGTRAAYFDKAGILRDMVQNHLMQLLCLLTMEAPQSFSADDISARKIDVLRSLKILECHRFQYQGYREENGVDPNSRIETYAELKLHINNFRWAGVPIYIRSGKALGRNGTEIGVRFKPLPTALFENQPVVSPNTIVFLIQPEPGIILSMASKEPGGELKLKKTDMTMCFNESFEKEAPEAYERLLVDAVRGDHTLFVNAREAELSWKLLDEFLDKGELETYPRANQPVSHFQFDWVKFESYGRFCSVRRPR